MFNLIFDKSAFIPFPSEEKQNLFCRSKKGEPHTLFPL